MTIMLKYREKGGVYMVDTILYKSVFDIIGPVMVGPSSSHTAGAARIGKMARQIFGEQPDSVDIWLYESFAKTYRGHGTDIAIVGGLLGMEPDDPKLADALKIAYEKQMEVLFVPKKEAAEHPNQVTLKLTKGNRNMSITGLSIGGGNIQISKLNDFNVSISMGTPTLLLIHQDVPGIIANITALLSKESLNISKMNVSRLTKGEQAITVLEIDDRHIGSVVSKLQKSPNIQSVSFFS